MVIKKIFSKETIIQYRYNMVRYAKANNITKAAIEYNTTRKTVRKWLNAYEKDGEEGLRNKSRLSQKHPNKLSDDITNEIIKYRKKSKLGAYYIKENLNLQCSEKTIYKKIKQANLIKKKKTKHKKKKDMRELRAKFKPLDKIQIDVKYLTDIPNIFEGIIYKHIPKYQITARDYCSGLTFLGYSNNKDSTSIGIFTEYVISMLKYYEVDISNTHFQSDNGCEFRNIKKNANKKSLYEEILATHGISNIFNPPGRPTFNSDVESFHDRIEKEFYDIEKFKSSSHFLYKANLYLLWYNVVRKNRNKNHSSPLTILKEHNINKYNMIASIPPIFVDNYVKDIILIKKGGYLKWLSPKNKIFIS